MNSVLHPIEEILGVCLNRNVVSSFDTVYYIYYGISYKKKILRIFITVVMAYPELPKVR